MRASMVGLGKLGFPVALTWATEHEMVGYDISPHAKEIVSSKKYPHLEPGAQNLLDLGTDLRVVDTLDEAVAHGDIVFVSVQTPHGVEYEGTTRMPETRADFDYGPLCSSVRAISESARTQKKHVTLVIISTVLPGTSHRELLPIIAGNEYVSFVYAPMFIAQGTVVEDTMNPEFVLLGVDKSGARGIEETRAFFQVFHSLQKLRYMSVASAELTKVAYNVALSVKITIANTLMEICHLTGANVDDVTDALGAATDRVISRKYLRGGMPDAGPCHPRDIIAMAWLAQNLDLTYDFFGSMVRAREAQAEFVAEVSVGRARELDLPIVLLGEAYKKETNLTIGSSAILLRNVIEESFTGRTFQWDPIVGHAEAPFSGVGVYVIATDHDIFYSMKFPAGSVIIDPWGQFQDQEGVEVVRLGRR